MTNKERRTIRNFKHKQKYQPYIFEVLIRDNNRCVDCGQTKELLVHHIDKSRKTGKLNKVTIP
jgi:hypothetical protein